MAVIAATTDTRGVVGIVIGGAGTINNAKIAVAGVASCVFDNATTAGDYVTISSSTLWVTVTTQEVPGPQTEHRSWVWYCRPMPPVRLHVRWSSSPRRTLHNPRCRQRRLLQHRKAQLPQANMYLPQ